MNRTKDINVAVKHDETGHYWAPVVFEPKYGPWQGPFKSEEAAHAAACAAMGLPPETLKEL